MPPSPAGDRGVEDVAGGNILGGASYRQATAPTASSGVVAAPVGQTASAGSATDAVQTLIAQTQSVIDEATATPPAGDAATRLAMIDPQQPAAASDGAVAAAPSLELGSFRRDEAPAPQGLPALGYAPDGELSRGEGIGSGPVVLDSVEYDERGEIVIGGRAAPESPLNVYVDNVHVGSAIAGESGRWSVTPANPLSEGLHYLRVDQVEAGGRVVARVESPFARVAPLAVVAGDSRVVVQPGNSLWRIARRALGGGTQYTAIYEANKSQIADPDMIYPGQIFVMPEAASEN
jgi:nucleoid-associated protein YgaU